MKLSKVKNFPIAPGVYQFIDKRGRILYIGRAINLKRRVAQYFQRLPAGRQGSLDPRITEMVNLARNIKYKKTNNLLEAIILEANLIKKHWPKYNVKDKDNRSFIYIAISKKDDFPKPIIIRGQEIKNLMESSSYFDIFGPYQSLSLVNSALKIIRRIFPYSTCLPAGRPANPLPGRPCFNYQIGLCPGACIGAISKEDYQKNIKNIILLLKGERKKLITKLKKDNPDKAKALDHIRDVSLMIGEQQSISRDKSAYRIEAYDISHLAGKETVGAMAVFINNEPVKDQYRKFIIREASNNDLLALQEIVSRRIKHKEWTYPDLILIDGGWPQITAVIKILEIEHINIPLIGLSKYAGDKLIFPKSMKKSMKDLITGQKNTLLKIRDEAHRFAISFSRKKRVDRFFKASKIR